MSNLLFIILGIIIITILSFVLLVIIKIKFKFVFAGYCILILVLSLFFLIKYIKNNNSSQEPPKQPPIQYKPIADPKITNVETYFEGWETYPHPSNIKKEYSFNKDTDNIFPSSDDPDIYILSKPNAQAKGILINKSTYRFEGLNGLDKCQYLDKVPKDLSPYVRRAFNDWKYYTPTVEHFGYEEIHKKIANDIFNFNFEIYEPNGEMHGDPISVFYQPDEYNCFKKKSRPNELYMNYTGPQYLLEEDKDFYINEVEIFNIYTLPDGTEKLGDKNTYYLHFNPVKQYITLYTEKMNTKFTYEKNKTKI